MKHLRLLSMERKLKVLNEWKYSVTSVIKSKVSDRKQNCRTKANWKKAKVVYKKLNIRTKAIRQKYKTNWQNKMFRITNYVRRKGNCGQKHCISCFSIFFCHVVDSSCLSFYSPLVTSTSLASSSFTDNPAGYVLTSDLNIVDNTSLLSVLSKCPK